MKKIRNWSIGLLSLLLFLWGLYAFLFDFVVPKTAQLTIPRKWQMLPLRQTKEIIHDYLGAPIARENRMDSTSEDWTGGSKGKMYSLRIYYSDTTAIGYAIHHRYENRLLSKNYLIDSLYLR